MNQFLYVAQYRPNKLFERLFGHLHILIDTVPPSVLMIIGLRLITAAVNGELSFDYYSAADATIRKRYLMLAIASGISYSS